MRTQSNHQKFLRTLLTVSQLGSCTIFLHASTSCISLNNVDSEKEAKLAGEEKPMLDGPSYEDLQRSEWENSYRSKTRVQPFNGERAIPPLDLSSEREIVIGTIRYRDPNGKFVLVRSSLDLSEKIGTSVEAKRQGVSVARLVISEIGRGNFVAADVINGQPQAGDEVITYEFQNSQNFSNLEVEKNKGLARLRGRSTLKEKKPSDLSNLSRSGTRSVDGEKRSRRNPFSPDRNEFIDLKDSDSPVFAP